MMKLRDLKLGEEFKYPRSDTLFRRVGVSLAVGQKLIPKGVPHTALLIYDVANHFITFGDVNDKVILHEAP